jgi:uncharacterized protein YcbX
MPVTLAQIYRYPVKGLSPEPLTHVTLTRGLGLPQDRRFALAHATTHFDSESPSWMPKTKFLMLMRNERLAQLRTRFDEVSGLLTIEREGRVEASGNLHETEGRAAIENFFMRHLGTEVSGTPKLLEAPGHMFSDVARKVVSIIGLPSVRDLERVLRHPVDPRRFRANFYVDGGRAWQEFDWVGTEFRVGAVRLRGVKPISRCAATNVDPETGARDLNIPLALGESFEHVNTGIYADVLDDGVVQPGDRLMVPA